MQPTFPADAPPPLSPAAVLDVHDVHDHDSVHDLNPYSPPCHDPGY
jgi:hypothetical protein